jgi:hypothetical protein
MVDNHDLSPVRKGELLAGRHLLAGIVQQVAELRVIPDQAVRHMVVLLMQGLGSNQQLDRLVNKSSQQIPTVPSSQGALAPLKRTLLSVPSTQTCTAIRSEEKSRSRCDLNYSFT